MSEPTASTPKKPQGTAVPEPIAIVGIGCRFPGGANTPATFWSMLCAGVDAIGAMPLGRFPQGAFDDSTPSALGKIATRQGGFLERIDEFDAQFFGVSPREAKAMDPQQRLLLETAWEAIEDAGMARERLAGSNTGVYVGMWTNEYEDAMFAASDDIDLYMTTGGGRYAASGRLSYVFDLQGPSLTVDTACSSALVAVHLACQSLWAGEIDMALAGAVNLILQPAISIGYSRSRMLSPDGRCKFGDAHANGYVRSEGCAVVALKPLSRAVADGDQIYALIRGTAINNDGHSSGLLVAPSGQGQLTMLRQAYRQAGVIPGLVDYVEAHGTGTPVGDPVELQALGAVLAEGRASNRPCLVGSVKTNIGHTEAASGMAGLIKAALCLKHGAIPASLHFETPNPNIPWAELPLKMQHSFGPWPTGNERNGQRYAGVNSFGVTGTNAHVVLEASPERASFDSPIEDNRPAPLAISASTPAALVKLARSYRTMLDANETAFTDLCYSASTRRTHHSHRLAIVASNRAVASEALDSFLCDTTHPALVTGQTAAKPPKIAFIFPGQGAQWFGMARELLGTELVFREAIRRCDAAIHAEAGWSPLGQLLTTEAESRLDEIDIIQPTLFAVQVGLATLWQSWGVQPAAVVGHSMGEVAAVYIAGALSLEDAARVICLRSQLLRGVRGQGAMAVVDLSLDEARAAITGYADRLAIAVSNSARSTVLSGDPVALDAVMAQLRAQDVFCRAVKVDVASHSPQVDPLLDELRAGLTMLRPQPAALPIYSTVDDCIAQGQRLNADYWARNLRQPVLFANAIQRLIADDITHFIEISPHPLLLPAVEHGLREAKRPGMALPSLRREQSERTTLLASLGSLYTVGAIPSWPTLFPAGARFVKLPTYPWQRERFWYEQSERRPSARAGHPLLGKHFMPAGQNSHSWETSLDLNDLVFLTDHRPRGSVILPATAFIEFALSAAAEAYGSGTHRVENFALTEALVLNAEAPRLVQVELASLSPNKATVRIFSAADASANERQWQLHAEGLIQLNAANEALAHEMPTAIRAKCTTELSHEDYYRELEGRELVYGPTFRTVERCWRGDGEAIGLLHTTASPDVAATATATAAQRITLLDGCLQLAVAALPANALKEPYLPVAMDSAQVFTWPPNEGDLWGHATVTGRAGDQVICDVVMLDIRGNVLAEVRGLHLQPVARTQATRLNDLLFNVQWVHQALGASSAGSTLISSERWLILDGDGLGEALMSRLAARGAQCILVKLGTSFAKIGPDRYEINAANCDDLRAFLQSQSMTTGAHFSGIVHAWSLAASTTTDADLIAAQDLCAGSIVNLVQAIADVGRAVPPCLWLVTQGAQAIDDAPSPLAPAQALTWGIGRTIANEYPELRCTLIDLDPSDERATRALQLEREIVSGSPEGDDQIAWRDGARSVARLVQHQAHAADTPAREEAAMILTTGAEQPYRLVATVPGSLDSLQPQPIARRTPGPGEIEVRVDAAALNFIDVLKAMGIYPGLEPSPTVALGAECAGTVVTVGQNVESLTIGDRVMVITPSYANTSCLSAYVTVPASFAAPTPTGLSQTEAAAMPIVFMTAYYALHELGRLRVGERVLIHAAAGGVGLAAIQLCQRAGAVVFATAGNPAKRDFLRSLGVEYVYDSRSLDFADQIMADTNGAGVNAVLNSLAGAAIPRSLDILAPHGRFLEIGKRDIYADTRIGLAPFRKNLSFFAIDLARWTDEDPAGIAELFGTVMGLIESGEVRPLPLEVFPIGAAADAFRTMAQARHIGKVIIALGDEPVRLAQSPDALVRADATYLITGGLGGLGLATATWLVAHGARYIALLARSTPSPAAQQAIAQLAADGAQVLVLAADVADAEQLRVALDQVKATMPQLAGVIHAAGLLADATLAQMNHEQLLVALAPKVRGAWNLHALTRDTPLDFFVLFSSIAALLGLPGQANYAAGNAFLDTLAHHRRAAGLKALSINWGPWAEVGLAAAQSNRGERLADRGLGSLSPSEGIAALEALLRADAVQATVMRFDPQRWSATTHHAANTLLADLSAAQATPSHEEVSLRAVMLEAEPGKDRRTVIETFVRAQLAQVLHIAPNRIEGQKPLKTLGLDSLMALELRNLLEADSGLTLPATLAWNYPTVITMANHLAKLLDVPLDEDAQVHDTPMTITQVEGKEEHSLGDVSMDDDDIEAVLNAELAEAERVLSRK